MLVPIRKTMSSTTMSEPPGFSELSKAEQVDYLMSLWDQIAAAPGEIPVPESHLQLSETRLRDYRKDPSSAHSSFEVLDRFPRK
jgi:putative addiction module component (TIGR02574 family)